ncbi:hypothetical protein ACLKA6_010955 [Drosophila palustris]
MIIVHGRGLLGQMVMACHKLPAGGQRRWWWEDVGVDSAQTRHPSQSMSLRSNHFCSLVHFWQCAQPCHLPLHRINDCDCDCNPFGHVLASSFLPFLLSSFFIVCGGCVMREFAQRIL